MKSATKVLFSSKRKTVMQLLFHVEFFLFQSMSAFISIQYNTIKKIIYIKQFTIKVYYMYIIISYHILF